MFKFLFGNKKKTKTHPVFEEYRTTIVELIQDGEVVYKGFERSTHNFDVKGIRLRTDVDFSKLRQHAGFPEEVKNSILQNLKDWNIKKVAEDYKITQETLSHSALNKCVNTLKMLEG